VNLVLGLLVGFLGILKLRCKFGNSCIQNS